MQINSVVVALDIGSAASRAMAFSKTGEVLAQSQSEYQTYFSRPGWVEQDALEIWEATQKALRSAGRGCSWIPISPQPRFRWILDNVEEARRQVEKGEAL
jgi:glycerol kinase